MITYVGWSPHRSHRLFVACVHRLTISWCCCWTYSGVEFDGTSCDVRFCLLRSGIFMCCVRMSSSAVFGCPHLLCSGVLICCVWVSPSAVFRLSPSAVFRCLHLLCSGVSICCCLPQGNFRSVTSMLVVPNIWTIKIIQGESRYVMI